MLKARVVCLASYLVATAGFAAAADVSLSPALRRTLNRITADSLRGHVSFLASDLLQGRNTPSPGLDIAAEYIASQFRRAGLEPAGNDGYFQTAPFVNATPNLEEFEFAFQQGDKTVRIPKEAVSVYNSGEVSVTGAKVFKIRLDADMAIKPEQVEGKVIVVGSGRVNPGAMRAFRELLSKAKPAAVVRLGSQRPAQRPNGPARAELRDSTNEMPPTVLVDSAELRAAVEALPAGDTDAAVSLHIAAAKEEPVLLRNVAGLRRGSDPALKDTYVIVSAHYDHIGVNAGGDGDRINNGADDNASGTATVMELASAFSAMNPRPKRSLLFLAFFGEEKGLFGSRYYTRHPLVPLEKTVANVNIEEVGRTDDSEGPQVGKLSMTGFGFSDITAVFEKAARLTGIEIPRRQKQSEQYFSGSDNLSFAQVGVPAHTLSVTYMFPDYHRPGDEWQKLNYDNMVKVDRMLAAGVAMIANNPKAPKWNEANPKTEPYVKAARELKATAVAAGN